VRIFRLTFFSFDAFPCECSRVPPYLREGVIGAAMR
jgi:hypothetical protein